MKLLRTIPFSIAALVLACAAHANEYTLTFADGTCGVIGCTNAALVNQAYGDVAGLVNITYTNVLSGETLLSWGPDYSDLNSVVYANGSDANSSARITLTAAPGLTLNLLSFDMGAWKAYATTEPAGTGTHVSVTSSLDATGFNYAGVVGTDGLHKTFNNFGTAGIGNSVSINWFNSAFNVGLDNLKFSVTAVPEPDTYALMLAGLGLLGAVARKKSSA